MKRLCIILATGSMMCACVNHNNKEVMEQMQYSKTHTGYADSATLHFALEHGITPDSAIVLLKGHEKNL